MADLANRYFIDGIDLWTAFGIIVEKGSADFLRWAPRKPSTQHDWLDSHGIEVDTTAVFFDSREAVLNMALFADNDEDFWTKHDLFISNMTQPGTRRFTVAAHGERSYYIIYQQTNNYHQIKSLKGLDTDYKIAQRFSLVVLEPKPSIDQEHVFIVDETGAYLIT